MTVLSCLVYIACYAITVKPISPSFSSGMNIEFGVIAFVVHFAIMAMIKVHRESAASIIMIYIVLITLNIVVYYSMCSLIRRSLIVT